MEMNRRALNILTAIDQFVWVLLTLGWGHPDETISAACFRMELKGGKFWSYARRFVDLLFSRIEHDHCYHAWRSEYLRSQLPVEYRS